MLTFTVPTTGGMCNFRLFANNGFAQLATGPPVTVTAASPTLGVNAMSVIAGGTVTVTITNGPGGITDRVGPYSTAAGDLTFVDWRYLNGTKTAPVQGATTAPLIFHDAGHKRAVY